MTADQKSWTEMIFRLLSVKGIGDVIANRLLELSQKSKLEVGQRS